ncbi:MAG: S8 family peptidase [Bacteroidales bacterium]|jgi:subtilisin family serine protease|nr:S8 family peptidase [Bacteroidales bacterium]
MFYLKKIGIVFFFLLLFQEAVTQTVAEYVIVFTDKPRMNNCLPSSFLSQRALERRQRYHIPIVEEDYPIDSLYIDAILRLDVNMQLISKSKWLNYIVVSCDTSLLDKIQQIPFVKQVSALHLIDYSALIQGKVFREVLPEAPNVHAENNDEMVDTAWYGSMFPQIKIHNGHLLHHAGYKGEGMLIAILDCGYAGVYTLPAFEHLHNENRLLGHYDFVKEGGDMFSNNSHGMHVLSTMASNIPYTAVGTAPKAQYVIIKTEAFSYEQIREEYFLVEGLECADSIGADVINISLGYSVFNDTTTNHTFMDLDELHSVASIAISLSTEKGMLVSASAGNEGERAWKYINIPGNGYNTLCVAAVNSDGQFGEFSSRGSLSFKRLKPNIASAGWNTVLQQSNGDISMGSGTSFSSPVNAGLVACLRQAYPQKNSHEIIQAIFQSCNHTFSPDTLTGYGIPDYWTAFRILEASSLSNDNILTVYPNPVQSILTVKAYYPKNIFRVEIIDITGRTLFVLPYKGNDCVHINTSNLSAGVYILRIHTDKKIITKRISKLTND